MGNIFTDIVEDITIKPSKSKLVLKWVIRVAVILIIGAFTFGQIKVRYLNRMDLIETNISTIKTDMKTNFNELNEKIDKIYTDGTDAFGDYQNFTKQQLLLIVDYGQENKELLKRILDLNIEEKTRDIENQLEQAKRETAKNDTLPKFESNIKITPIKKN